MPLEQVSVFFRIIDSAYFGSHAYNPRQLTAYDSVLQASLGGSTYQTSRIKDARSNVRINLV